MRELTRAAVWSARHSKPPAASPTCIMLMPQCERWAARWGSSTMSHSSSAYEYTSAPLGVMVPSFTTSGYFFPVASKCRRAEPLPPVPSKCCVRQAGGAGSG